MTKTLCASLAFVLLGGVGRSMPAAADELAEITNFRQYSPRFASSGQPTEQELSLLKTAGFERVIYIAYSDHDNSLPNEDRVAKDLGLEYVQIPVEWTAPTATDFNLFAGVMQQAANRKTLLHCQVNYRASAFSFLYRVVYEGVPVDVAKADMDTVWSPNPTWRKLIFQVLESHGIDPQCDGCDWSSDD